MTVMTPTIKCGKCRGRHKTVEEVRNCYLDRPASNSKQSQNTLFRQPKREPVTEDGMYKLGENVYKVQVAVHGSGKLYAKKLVREGEVWVFRYDTGAIRKLSATDKMSLEQAKAWGKLYETCCVCGATLTDDSPGGSIENGIGPVCGKRFG